MNKILLSDGAADGGTQRKSTPPATATDKIVSIMQSQNLAPDEVRRQLGDLQIIKVKLNSRPADFWWDVNDAIFKGTLNHLVVATVVENWLKKERDPAGFFRGSIERHLVESKYDETPERCQIIDTMIEEIGKSLVRSKDAGLNSLQHPPL